MMHAIRHVRRRGAAYLVALLAGSIVTVTGLAALSLANTRAKESILTDHEAEARLLSQSALEHAMGAITARFASGDDRHDLTSTFRKTVSLNDGRFAWRIGEVNGAAINNVDGPFLLQADGERGSADRRLEALLAPSGLPMTILDTAMYAGRHVSVSSAAFLNADHVVGAKDNFSAAAGSINADVEAGGSVSGTVYLGTTTSGADRHDLPNKPDVLNYYQGLGSTINFDAIGYDGGARTLQNVLLSPTSNPFGPTNPLGVYVIDLRGERFVVRNIRIEGTLVLLNSNAETMIGANVFMRPAYSWLPSLVVDGDVIFAGNGFGPNEATIGVNLNPTGTPYDFEHDDALDDVYPGRIEGVVYATHDIQFVLLSQSFRGTVIADHDIIIRTGATVNITYDPGVAQLPPFGFFDDQGGLALDPSTVNWMPIP